MHYDFTMVCNEATMLLPYVCKELVGAGQLRLKSDGVNVQSSEC